MQRGRGLEQLVIAMNYLDSDYFLLMVGDGPLKNDLEYLSMNNKNIYFTGMVKYNELADYTSLADLGIILFENNSLNNYYASPNKMFEYIHGNIPILAPNYPFMRFIVNKYKIGFLIDNIDPVEISTTIKNIFIDKPKLEQMRLNIQKAKNDLNWEIEGDKLIDLYKKNLCRSPNF